MKIKNAHWHIEPLPGFGVAISLEDNTTDHQYMHTAMGYAEMEGFIELLFKHYSEKQTLIKKLGEK
jgi:hypothetical protein